MKWCAWCLSWREIWQTPCSGTVVRCLILSRLDTLQLKRDRLDGPLMTRMMFWLCKEREISRSNHRSRHMSCHRLQNNQYPVSSKDPLECHEAGGAPWVLETFWYIPGIAWCNPLCPHRFQSSTCCFAFSCTLLAERWPSCRRLKYSSWSSPGMINLSPFRSIPSSVDSSSLKSQYLLAKRGTCLLWCGQPCCVSCYTIARMGSLCMLSFSFSIHGFVKAM